MRLTAKLALSQLKVNRRQTIWTMVGIILSSGMLMTTYGLGYGTTMELVDRLIVDNPFATREVYMRMINGLALIMTLFIIVISVIVVSNAFRVSAADRSAQFGILKSIGATRKQIIQTIAYEGLFLTMIAVPIGLILGLLMQWIFIVIFNTIFQPLLDEAKLSYLFRFIISPMGMLMAIIISKLTVFLSAWLPARKISKIPAISAIRGTGEVQVSNKKVRGNKLISKVFGFEGVLAQTFLKRSKRNFRATVIAMTFSVMIFIVAGGFLTQMGMFTEIMWEEVYGNVHLSFQLQDYEEVNCDEGWDNLGNNGWRQTMQDSEGNLIQECFVPMELSEDEFLSVADIKYLTERLQEQLGSTDTFIGSSTPPRGNYATHFGAGVVTEAQIDAVSWDGMREENPRLEVVLRVVDAETYRQLAEAAGVGLDENILINHFHRTWADGRRIRGEMIYFDQQTIRLEKSDRNETSELTLHGAVSGEDVPVQLRHIDPWELTVIVPDTLIQRYSWDIATENPAEVAAYAEALLEEMIDGRGSVWAMDRNAHAEEERRLTHLVSMLVYSFVGALALIGTTNVISTISENVKSRAKEFAVLKSVGMTGGGIGRMLALESLFSAIKSLLYGVPLGLLGAYRTWHMIGAVAQFDFPIPWDSIIIAVIVVLILTLGTMNYAIRKLRHQNIIETIRAGSGM